MAAFTILFIAAMLLFGGLICITLNYVVDEMIDAMNPFITAGTVSKQFVTYFTFLVGLVVALPIFYVITLALWGIVRAIERRQEDGY